MDARTVFLSRLIGLSFIITALVMFLHGATFVSTMTVMLHNTPLMFLLCLIMIVAGLAIVLTHNHWSGVAAFIVTLLGWILLVKGTLLLMLTPESAETLFINKTHYQDYYHLYTAIQFVIGVYLTYWGFRKHS
jgi:hypothetical protein